MNIIKSKRFWLNLATAGAMLLTYAGVLEIPVEWKTGITFGIAIVNLVLQMFFNQDTAKQ